MQRPQSSIIMLIIIVAVILAVASSLALFALQGRPDAPEEQVTIGEQIPTETQIINVEGTDVMVRRTVDNALFMQPVAPQTEIIVPEQATSQPAQEEQPAPEQQVEQTQEQPAEQQTEQTTQEQPQPQATAVVPANRANPAVDSIIYQSYTVQANDTLYNITRQFATSITLMAVKGIDQDDLVPGAVLQIPVGNPAYCPGLQPYAVGEGDTIFSIAQRRNTTKETLQAINNLDANYTIFSGTIICVP